MQRASWWVTWFVIITIGYATGAKLMVFCCWCWAAIMGWLWFCDRFPRTAWFVFGFIEGLLGSNRRRW